MRGRRGSRPKGAHTTATRPPDLAFPGTAFSARFCGLGWLMGGFRPIGNAPLAMRRPHPTASSATTSHGEDTARAEAERRANVPRTGHDIELLALGFPVCAPNSYVAGRSSCQDVLCATPRYELGLGTKCAYSDVL